MPVLNASGFAGLAVVGDCSPLNRIWRGRVTRPFQLPQLGHIFLIFPGETAVACNGATLKPDQYSLLTEPGQPVTLNPAAASRPAGNTLILLLSPGFILDMADFRNIPAELNQLLHNIPLPQGDALSSVLKMLANASTPPVYSQRVDELMLEAVGEVLRLLRLRHQALHSLANRKASTTADLLPRLLQARQFVEARYLEPINIASVASYVSLSEFHFARLFRAAFGVSLHQFMLRLRLDEARRCLLAGSMSVTDVGQHVGYSSLSSFIHAFKRRFGSSPAQYRTYFQNAQD